jgi:hypothetical protein
MRKLNLEIVNVLTYDEYGRCKNGRTTSERSTF